MTLASPEDDAVETLFSNPRLCPRQGFRAMSRVLLRRKGAVCLQQEAASACRMGAQAENRVWGRGR